MPRRRSTVDDSRGGEKLASSAAPFARTLLFFALGLAALELAGRAAFARYASPALQGELATRGAWLRDRPRASVLWLGDSSTHYGFSPEALRAHGGPAALNAGVTAGTPLVAQHLVQRVAWSPDEVVYGALPVQLLDTFPLQQYERAVVPLWDPRARGLLSPEVVLGRAWHAYGMRARYLLALEEGLERALDGAELSRLDATQDALGFARAPSVEPVSAEGCRAGGAALVASWIARPMLTGRLRAHSLARTFERWPSGATRRTAVLMPFCSAMRVTLYARIPRATLAREWADVARASGAALLDCTEAVADSAFFDADHLRAAGAEEFTARFVSWFARREVPRGCVQLAP